MNTTLTQEFDFLPKTGRPASFGQAEGRYPFFTSSAVLSKWTDSPDCEGPALVFGTGGSASLHYVDIPFSASNDCYIVRPKSEKNEDAKFYFFFLLSNMHLIEEGFRGAGLKHVTKKHLEKIVLPKSHGNSRNRVISILEKADSVRKKRQRLVETISGFIRSAYLHTVGHFNPSHGDWEPFTIDVLAEDRKGAIRSGPFGSALRHGEFVDEGIAVLGIDNAVQNRFAWAERRFITPSKYEELRRYRVFPGDVIITIMGTTGRSAVVPDDIPEAITTKHLATITCNKELIHPEVLSFAIHSDPLIIRQIKSFNKGAIMDGLNLGIIRKLEINLPPMEEQLRFVRLLRKARAIETRYQTSEGSGEDLFQSLSQRAFRGEL